MPRPGYYRRGSRGRNIAATLRELAKQLDSRRLGVEVTARNWRTVTKMLELVGSPR